MKQKAVTKPSFRLLARVEQAAFLALPWMLPLEEWPPEQFVEFERGIGRHVVRFVELAGVFYALKELPQRLAEREYRLLGAFEREGVTSPRRTSRASCTTSAPSWSATWSRTRSSSRRPYANRTSNSGTS